MDLRIIALQGKMNREKQHEGKVSLASLFQIKSLKIFYGVDKTIVSNRTL